jgi:ectoine hydroxylase-related dioxygenase (phytanoyl-CoA dioxygenase family)
MNSLDEQRFEILTNCITPEVIPLIVESLAHSNVTRSRAGMRHALQVPAVRSLAESETLIELAKQVLGPHAFPFRATLFDKSSESNWLVVWHQDTALPLRERRAVAGWGPWSVKEGTICAHAPASALQDILAIRVHLDDCNPDNGSLKVLPGTHHGGVLTDDAIHELAASTSAAECCVRAGGVLAMRPLLVHASSKAQSSARRRVLHIEYASRACFEGDLELALD